MPSHQCNVRLMMNLRLRLTAGLACCLLLVAGPALGQRFSEYEVSGTSYRVFARPGQNTIQVLVIGNGGQSGLYKIGADTDLARLLALSGGASGGGRTETTIRLYRPQDGQRELVFEAELNRLIEESGSSPALQAGDVIQIESVERRGFGWRDALQIVTAVATTTFAIERIVRLFD